MSDRALRQLVETASLLGVDFVPVRMNAAPAVNPNTARADAQVSPSAASAGEKAVRRAALDELRERHDAECPHCTSVTEHTQTVFGEGDPCANIMFVGEAPGAEEDRTGRPFVGRAGQLLDKMINAMGLQREDVYIANILKARPPNNATPTFEEAARCGPYLAEQIRIIRPRAIVTLGKPAAQFLLGSRESMGRLRGVWQEYEGVPVMPTFHPAYLLRQYTRENREKVWSDLQKVLERAG